MQTRRCIPVVVQLLREQATGALEHSRGLAHLALPNQAKKHGSGGRSSVSGATITVFGGTGFVGKYVVNELARGGSQVVCPFRCSEEKALPLKQMGDLSQVVILRDFSIHDDDFVRRAIARSDVVVNLIGTSLPTRNFSLETVNTEWPARLARMAADAGCLRLLHFSDAGAAEDHASAKLRSKAAGDQAVREAFPQATIVKPCTVVGDEDDFFNNILGQVKSGPVVPLWDGGSVRLQPTYVPDVAAAVVAMLQRAETAGQELYLGGPEVLTMRQVVDLVYRTLLEDEDETLSLPSSLGRALLKPLQALQTKLPILPFTNPMHTVDFIDEISRDKVVPAGALGYAALDILPQKVTDGLAIEALRHGREGGYQLGDASAIAKNLPTHIRKYYGMEVDKNA